MKIHHLAISAALLGSIATSYAQVAPTSESIPAVPAFADVPRGHWASAAVQKLATAGIIEGFPAGVNPPPIASVSKLPVSSVASATYTDIVLITPRIKTAFGANRALFGSAINVDTVVATKTIHLRGTTRTQTQKLLAETIARKYAGGFKIVNQLRTMPAR